jgi:hypothetical protein
LGIGRARFQRIGDSIWPGKYHSVIGSGRGRGYFGKRLLTKRAFVSERASTLLEMASLVYQNEALNFDRYKIYTDRIVM